MSSAIASGVASDLVSRTLSILVSVLFLVVKLLNSSCVDTKGVSSVSEAWGGDKVIPVENGMGDSCRTRTLFAFRV